jgi:hypothetical protein
MDQSVKTGSAGLAFALYKYWLLVKSEAEERCRQKGMSVVDDAKLDQVEDWFLKIMEVDATLTTDS